MKEPVETFLGPVREHLREGTRMRNQTTVILGGGAAGTACAQAISSRGGEAIVIEPRAHRVELPPLTKSLFGPELTLTAHPTDLPGITVIDGEAARITDTAVLLDDGTQVAYDQLVIATGLMPRTPPPGFESAHSIHSADDALRWREILASHATQAAAGDIGVLGSGYLALETARGAADAGFPVTVHLRGERPLPQVHPLTSQVLRELHETAGVRFVVNDPAPDPSAHGQWIIAIGAVPRLPELPAGWQGAPGEPLRVDAHLRLATRAGDADSGGSSAAPGNVWAIGDVAQVSAGTMSDHGHHPAESTAQSQGVWLGAALADASSPAQPLSDQQSPDQLSPAALRRAEPSPASPETTPPWSDVPWHWSFQGPVRLFTAGTSAGSADPTPVLTGDFSHGRGQLLLFSGPTDEAHMVGVETLGAPAAHNAARRVLASGNAPTRAEAGRSDFDLRAWERAHR